MRLLALLLLPLLAFASLEELARFFEREGFVVERENGTVILDLGKGKAFPGEEFEVLEREKELRHPVTGEVIGYKEKPVGLARVKRVERSYSEAELIKDEGVKPGQRVRLHAPSVCFEGSEETFFALKKLLPQLKRGTGCPYTVREMRKGFGVVFKGEPVAFFPKGGLAYLGETAFEDFAYRAKLLSSFNELPYSADACDLFNGNELLVLFPDYLKVYELKGGLREVLTYRLPAGQPVSVVCYEGPETLVLVNMLVDGEASSAVLRPSGRELVLVARDVPYLFGKLEDELVGQSFNNGAWGEPYLFKIEGKTLSRKEKLDLPPEFRVDGAAKKDELLLFVDGLGRLHVYEGNEEVLTEDGFGLSYAQAELPAVHGYDEEKYFFHPRPAFTVLFNKLTLPLIPRNKMGGVFKVLGVAKFSEGELWTLIRRDRYYELRKLKGRPFKEAIQTVLIDKEGRTLVLTASKGTLPFQSKGELYELELRPF
ncbi:MAG: hypothetical protein GXO03_03160 [Aquificae bacterium]|nr:hypothetical protein [Aquificota bacterium]